MVAYLTRCGIALDILLNVILGGVAGQTISLRCALAMQAHNRIGCFFCRALSFLVERDHCAKQLQPGSEPIAASIRAGLLLAALAALIGKAPNAALWLTVHFIR